MLNGFFSDMSLFHNYIWWHQIFGQMFNYKISLKLQNLCTTLPCLLLCMAFLLLFPCMSLYYSADYMEGPSEKELNSSRGFQSDISFYKLDWNSEYWIMPWIVWAELKHSIAQIPWKTICLTIFYCGLRPPGYKIFTLLNSQVFKKCSVHKPW